MAAVRNGGAHEDTPDFVLRLFFSSNVFRIGSAIGFLVKVGFIEENEGFYIIEQAVTNTTVLTVLS